MFRVCSKGKKSGQTVLKTDISEVALDHKKQFGVSILFFLLCLTLCSCTKSKRTPHTASLIPPLRWATKTLPMARDWTLCTGAPCLRHAALTMQGLFRIDPVRGETELVLADRIDEKNNAIFEIEIRSPLYWSDGKQLSATDFTDSWKKRLSQGAKAPFRASAIRVLSPTKISIQVSSNQVDLPRLLASPIFWPRRLDSDHPTALTLGAFYSTAKEPHRYRRNPHFPRTPNSVEEIQFIPFAGSDQILGAYQEKSIDVVEDFDDRTAVRHLEDPHLKTFPTGLEILLHFPQAKNASPSLSPAHRSALVTAIDKDKLIALLRTPLLKAVSPPSSKSLNSAEPLVRLKWHSLSFWNEDSPLLRETADALMAAWAENPGVAVERIPGKKLANIQLRLHHANAYLPEATAELSSDRYHSMFEIRRAVLVQPSVKHLAVSIIGDWDFGSLEWTEE